MKSHELSDCLKTLFISHGASIFEHVESTRRRGKYSQVVEYLLYLQHRRVVVRKVKEKRERRKEPAICIMQQSSAVTRDNRQERPRPTFPVA